MKNRECCGDKHLISRSFLEELCLFEASKTWSDLTIFQKSYPESFEKLLIYGKTKGEIYARLREDVSAGVTCLENYVMIMMKFHQLKNEIRQKVGEVPLLEMQDPLYLIH